MTLTQLVHELSNAEAKILFVKVFFITEAREWNSIDVWRLDKFMMVMTFVAESILLQMVNVVFFLKPFAKTVY